MFKKIKIQDFRNGALVFILMFYIILRISGSGLFLHFTERFVSINFIPFNGFGYYLGVNASNFVWKIIGFTILSTVLQGIFQDNLKMNHLLKGGVLTFLAILAMRLVSYIFVESIIIDITNIFVYIVSIIMGTGLHRVLIRIQGVYKEYLEEYGV